jgi:hypothetical protein
MPVVPAEGLAPSLARVLGPMPLLIGLCRRKGARGRVCTDKDAGFEAAMSPGCITRAWSPQPVLPWLLRVENLPT